MIDPTVREAVGDDADELARLEREARRALVGARGGDRWLDEHPEIADGWREHVTVAPTFLALLDGVPVGYLVLDLARLDDSIASVDQVWVAPGAREVGFGDALLEAAVDRARRAGATIFEGQSLPGDRQTKNLYERAGIKARLITVSTRLEPLDVDAI